MGLSLCTIPVCTLQPAGCGQGVQSLPVNWDRRRLRPPHTFPFSWEHPEPSPAVRQRPVCSSPHHRAGGLSAGCRRGAGEVISETHHGFWNPLRGHTRRLEEFWRDSDAVRMITFQKLEASARKVFRGQLANSPAVENVWRGRRRKREFILLKTGSFVSPLGSV